MNDRRHDSFSWQSRQFVDRRGVTPADPSGFAELMSPPQFPVASAYDPAWVYANHMGPNVLWLVEWLSDAFRLTPGMRVLDLGCGTAMSSIFLAREFGVSVCAADLWISPHDNWPRIVEAGLQALVMPVYVEAHSLPFAQGYFDALVSFDAYQYFGTDERYLSYCSGFVRPGGTIGVVMPGNAVDVEEMPPDQRAHRYFQGPTAADFFTFRSPAWWKRLWSRSGAVEAVAADMMPDGYELWLRWSRACAAWKGVPLEEADDAPMLLAASGRSLGFTRVLARRVAS